MSDKKIRNMEEFSSVSGISRPTVSKYFNDPDSVRKSTRERIEEALAKHDYRPNFYAVNQNRTRTKNVGIVIPNVADPFFAEIARSIESVISAAGYRTILLSSHGGPEQENANLEGLRTIKPAGVILAPLGRSSDRAVVSAFCDNVPTVLIDCDIDSLGEAFIGTDHAQSMTLMVEYLCRSGESPVFLEMKTPPNPNALKHRAAYLKTMEALGHTPNFIAAEGVSWDFEAIGFKEGQKLFAQRELPSNTILCSNDRLAIGLLSAAYECGVKVGRSDDCDIRIAGHDDHPFARYTCPSLTTIAQDLTAIGQKSVSTLLGLIDSEKRADRRDITLFDGKLVLRESA